MPLKRASDIIVLQDVVKNTRRAYGYKAQYMINCFSSTDEYEHVSSDPEYDLWLDIPLPTPTYRERSVQRGRGDGQLSTALSRRVMMRM